MGGTMKKLKEIYLKNSIIRFLVSYILVLVIPLCILSYGFASAFQIVRDDIENSYVTMLEHSISLIDNETNKLESLALQITQTSQIKEFGKVEKGESGYIMAARDAIVKCYDLLNYHSVDVLDESYIYYRGMDLVMYDSTYYRPVIFRKYLKLWNITEVEWTEVALEPQKRVPEYIEQGGNLQYIMPFSENLTGDSQGILVFRLKDKVLKKLLNFSNNQEDNEYLIRIYDGNNQLLWSAGEMEKGAEVALGDLKTEGYQEKMGVGVVYNISSQSGWQYVLAVPQKQALYRLSVLKTSVFLLAGAAVVAGIVISLYLSVKQGKPINEVIQLISSSGKAPYNFTQLGEAVTNILNNHQELLEEIEQDRPLMQKAFFHDLIKAEFTNDSELKLAAKKAGILMEGTAYISVSFELFAGNDFYDVDEQTLDEVHIISQLLENYLVDSYSGTLWFYKKNYRVVMAIFAVELSEEPVKQVILQAREWLLTEHQVETNWGISDVCEDLLLLWKSSEESRTALHHCTSQSPVVEYKAELDNILEYYFPEIAQEKLIDCVCSGHMEEASDILDILERENCVNRNLSRPQFIKFNRKVTDIIPEILKQDSLSKELHLWLNETVIDPEKSHEEYFKRFRQLCQRACIENTETKKKQRGKMINEIREYIKSNYMDSGLGLAQVGTVFRVSEGYLSTVFKEQAGINFTDYLEGIRIKKACELLKDDKNTVSEISQRVGYNSVQSFRRAFKRVKGISPKETRM